MTSSSQTRSLAPPPIVWRSWPLRDEPAAARLTAVVLALLAAGVIVATGSAWLSLLATTAVVLAMWKLFVPLEYHLGARGLRQTLFGRSRLIRWSQIKVVEVRRHGVLFYPDTYFGPLRAMRGTYVPWCGQRTAVLTVIEFYASTILVDHEDRTTEQPRERMDATALDDTQDHEPVPRAEDDANESKVGVRHSRLDK